MNKRIPNNTPLLIGALTVGIMGGVLGVLVFAHDETAPAAVRVENGVDKLTLILTLMLIGLVLIGVKLYAS